jgi:nicotinate-nucleotide adenylyltransferase
MIREKISRGQAWRYLVPQSARYIIEDRCLYGFTGSAGVEKASGLAETIIRVENEIRLVLDFDRFIHSRNTALLAWDLCRRFGLDEQKGYLAGIAHDMCKFMGDEELVRLAHSDGTGSSKLEQQKPGLLHARAAAVQLRRKYGILDRDILEAIRCHTMGQADMGSLAQVVYIADKIEISRTKADPALREMSLAADLDTLFAAVLDNTVAYLRARQMDISYGTKRLLAAMNKRNKL